MRLPILLVVLCVASAASAQDAAAVWAALRAGGHVALVRHAGTVGGAGDPPGFRLDDCATQRNLTLKGRARRAGSASCFASRKSPSARCSARNGAAASRP